MITIPKNRIASIDLLRGAIMIIMALDHVRDYIYSGSFVFAPLDLQQTTPIVFVTRWVTHYCAPIFMLLAGVSAYLTGQRKTKKELTLFLLKRGIWLIFLELFVFNFAWNFNIHFPTVLFIVIWALGVSMIVLAGLIHLPVKFILLFCVILVAGHNLLDPIKFDGNNRAGFLWALLHFQQGFTWHHEILLVGYPLIPWIGVMPLGYCLGQWYNPAYPPEKRRKNLLLIGVSAILLFLVLRITNAYGDPVPWTQQKDGLFTFFSFLNVAKYPPSLLYLLVTLGPAFIFLSLTEKAAGSLVRIISVYGRVPMFYYIIHIYLIHLIAMISSAFIPGQDWKIWVLDKPIWFTSDLKGYGFSLTVMYLVWIAVVVSLYPLCKWYDRYKMQHKETWWLSYL